MQVTHKYQGYRCNICGNEVEVQTVGGGELVCCGQPMELTTKELTPVNLMKAFAGESQARNKYEFWAKAAKKEGFEQISAFFEETARNEKEHAKLEYKAHNKLMGKPEIDKTSGNLAMAAEGENYEHQTMYPEFAEIAEAEGYNEIAEMFRKISDIEVNHEKRYKKLKDLVDGKKVFLADGEIAWLCRNCGHIHSSTEAPEECPACKHPRAYFERLCENY